MNSTINYIEVIDLDSNESEEMSKDQWKCSLNIEHLNTQKSRDSIQDDNVGSTTIYNPHTIVPTSSSHEINSTKRMYLIPVNCLQFRNENDGEYAVNDINNGAIQSFNMFAEIKNHNDGKNVATPKQNTKLSNTLKLQKICDGKVESRPRLVVSPKLVKVADIKSGQSLFHPVIEKVKIPRKVGNITLVQSKVVSSGLPVRPSDPNAQFSVVRQVGVPTNPTMNLQCATSTNNFDTASTPVLPMNITRPHQYLVNSHSSLRSPNNSKDTSSDTVNTYEKMVTSDEDKHFLENALKNCFHGNGISDTDFEKLSNYIRTKFTSEPFKVMIPSKFVKYCMKKDGTYLLDLNTLKKINQKQIIVPNDDAIVISDEEQHNENEILNQRRKSTIETVIDSKNFSPETAIETSIKDKFRCFCMDTSWDRNSSNKHEFKGFSEEEKNISVTYLQNHMKLLSIAENYRWHTFRSKTDNTKNEQVPSTQCSELSSTNDLYFTRKIDILDKIGRRIRTEHIIPHDEEQNKRKIKPNTRNKRKKMKITNNCSLPKTKQCHIVIERNQSLENLFKDKVEIEKIKKNLDSKFIKSSHDVKKGYDKPMIILDKNNFNSMKFNQKFCENCNILYVKNEEDDFPEHFYKNIFFTNMVEKNLIKVTSPTVLQGYFDLREVRNHI